MILHRAKIKHEFHIVSNDLQHTTSQFLGVILNNELNWTTRNNDYNHHNTRHITSLHMACGNSELIYRCFIFHAIRIWNHISRVVPTNLNIPQKLTFNKTQFR